METLPAWLRHRKTLSRKMTQRKSKTIYQLRGKRRHRPAKPEYAMTGILVGIALGWIVGLGLELVYKKHTVLMIGAGVAGLILGAGFEATRFWWRMRRFRADNEPSLRQFS